MNHFSVPLMLRLGLASNDQYYRFVNIHMRGLDVGDLDASRVGLNIPIWFFAFRQHFIKLMLAQIPA
ncbi:MAG: hypothetical protein ABIW02_02280 [Nitrosospira sp.]